MFSAVKELMPTKEKDVEMETNPSYMSVVQSVQQRGELDIRGQTKCINVGLVN